ncbi:hypothetical protein [Paenibacillus aestuarii]|uniref:STAS/SEC14 domain-containing protein n=1 Tax=Paenibacillus aestuarii TaxID=516965 RepID=A0ABW0K2P3_9BACL|nr:hypothetical protein [Paenibacillus aestuarii]
MSEEQYTIDHNEQFNYVILKRNNFASKEIFQSSTNKSIELLKQHRSDKLIIDDTKVRFVTPENQEWILDHFSNTGYAQGLRFLAVVKPQSLIGEYTVNKIFEQAPIRTTTPIEVRFFSLMDEAEAWMREM